MNKNATVLVLVTVVVSTMASANGGVLANRDKRAVKGSGIHNAQQQRDHNRADIKDKLEDRKQERDEKMEKAKEQREKAMKERDQKAAAHKEDAAKKAEVTKEKMKERNQDGEKGKKGESTEAKDGQKTKYDETKAQTVVDSRQERQDKRIQHGIDKGYLTEAEVAKLNAQQTKIETLESSLTGDGSLSKQDFKQLQSELNTASHCIWGEKHDTDGNQMAAYRFGENVFAKSSLTNKMTDENLSKGEAKKICKDFRSMMDLKKQLSGNLSESERQKLQAQYDELLNQYFETR
jgi:hypothetical protein